MGPWPRSPPGPGRRRLCRRARWRLKCRAASAPTCGRACQPGLAAPSGGRLVETLQVCGERLAGPIVRPPCGPSMSPLWPHATGIHRTLPRQDTSPDAQHAQQPHPTPRCRPASHRMTSHFGLPWFGGTLTKTALPAPLPLQAHAGPPLPHRPRGRHPVRAGLQVLHRAGAWAAGWVLASAVAGPPLARTVAGLGHVPSVP